MLWKPFSLCQFVSQHVTDLLLSDWLSVLPPVVLVGPRVLPSVALFGIAAVLVVSVAVIVPPTVLGVTALVFASHSDKIYFIL